MQPAILFCGFYIFISFLTQKFLLILDPCRSNAALSLVNSMIGASVRTFTQARKLAGETQESVITKLSLAQSFAKVRASAGIGVPMLMVCLSVGYTPQDIEPLCAVKELPVPVPCAFLPIQWNSCAIPIFHRAL